MIDQTDSVLLYDIKEKKLTTLVEQKNLMISSAVFADGKIVITATDGKHMEKVNIMIFMSMMKC